MNILVLHGPNLNLLGRREPKIYGTKTLGDINQSILAYARLGKHRVWIYQKNGEGQLIDLIHKYRKWAKGLIINPGAYTHYSYALRDAIAAAGIPAVEVHLSDISKREPFRKVSVIKPVCLAQVKGKGLQGYLDAIDILRKRA